MLALNSCERGAHGQFLRAPKRLKDAGLAHLRGVLRVYRHGNRTPPIAASSHELGVARSVPCVAPHRPAPRLIAEERQPGRVLPRSRRLGASPLDHPALLHSGFGAEQPAANVSADKGVEVGGGGDYAPRSPGPSCGHKLAYVLRRLLRGIVAVDETLRQLGSGRQAGAPQPRWFVHYLAELLLVSA